VSSRNRKSLSVLRLGPRTPVSSASLEAWDPAFQASIIPLQASSASLQASTMPLEARSGSLEASGSRSEISNQLIQAWTSVSELPDDAHRRSSASFKAWNAALQASSCALEVRFPSVLVTGGTLQVRARPPPASPGTLERTTADHNHDILKGRSHAIPIANTPLSEWDEQAQLALAAQCGPTFLGTHGGRSCQSVRKTGYARETRTCSTPATRSLYATTTGLHSLRTRQLRRPSRLCFRNGTRTPGAIRCRSCSQSP
jgi:hypothetical protein